MLFLFFYEATWKGETLSFSIFFVLVFMEPLHRNVEATIYIYIYMYKSKRVTSLFGSVFLPSPVAISQRFTHWFIIVWNIFFISLKLVNYFPQFFY